MTNLTTADVLASIVIGGGIGTAIGVIIAIVSEKATDRKLGGGIKPSATPPRNKEDKR